MRSPRRRLRVLVSGATGFIGSSLLRQLPPHWSTVALVRRDVAVQRGVTAVRLPEANAPLPEVLAAGFDILVHLAGNSNHGLAESEPWTDLDATARTAAVVIGRVPAARIILLSSAAVYAGLEGEVSPQLCLQPRTAYALSKLYTEGLVETRIAQGAAHGGVVFRLYNAFGPGERSSRLIPRVATAALSGASFTLTGRADSLSDPIHVDDVVRALIAGAESDVSGTFDLCGGDPVPLVRQIERIGVAVGRPLADVQVSPRAGEVPIRFYSNPVLTWEALRIAPPAPFQAAVRRYAAAAGWIRDAVVR